MTETKLDHTDVISVDGYCFESKPRQATYIRKSGGIGVFIKVQIALYNLRLLRLPLNI